MRNLFGRWAARFSVLLGVPALVIGGALVGTGNAAVDSSTSAAITGGLDDTKALILGVVAVGFFAIVLAVIGLKLGSKWIKKAAGQ